MTSIAQPSTKLLASLMAVADSGRGPASNVRFPITSNNGRHRSSASGGPAATIPSCPAAAMSGRPSTGAATSVCPASLWAASSDWIAVTPWVPIVTWMASGASESRRPPGPSVTSVSASSSASMVITTSAPAQASAIDDPAFAPRSPALPSCRGAVEDRELVSATEHPAGDRMTHATQADETDVHAAVATLISACSRAGRRPG